MYNNIYTLIHAAQSILHFSRPDPEVMAHAKHILNEWSLYRQTLQTDTLRLELAQRFGIADETAGFLHRARQTLMHQLTNAMAELEAHYRLICACSSLQAAKESEDISSTDMESLLHEAGIALNHYQDICPTQGNAICSHNIRNLHRLMAFLRQRFSEADLTSRGMPLPSLSNDITPFLVTGGSTIEGWIAWALNTHPDILALKGYEKLLGLPEDAQAEKNWLAHLPLFLQNVGRPSLAAGDCGSCTPAQAETVLRLHGDMVRVVHLVCHPYIYVEHFCAMPVSPSANPRSSHIMRTFEALHSLAGPGRLHGLRCLRAEDILVDRDLMQEMTSYLSAGRCVFSPAGIRAVYALAPEGWPDPRSVWASWPKWKRQAFMTILPEEILEMYHQQGYAFASMRNGNGGTSVPDEPLSRSVCSRPEQVCLELAKAAPPLAAYLNVASLSLPGAYYLPTILARSVRETLSSIPDTASLAIVADANMVLHFLEESRTRSGPLFYVDMDADDTLPVRQAFICPRAKSVKLGELAEAMPEVIIAAGPNTLQAARKALGDCPSVCIDFSELNERRCLEARDYIAEQITERLKVLNPDVLYVGNYIYFNMVRQSMALRQKGLKTAILVLEPTNLYHKKGFFDGVFTAWRDLTLLFSILRRIDEPRIIHVQGWMTQHYLPLLAKVAAPHAKIICEFNDIASYFAPWADYEKIWGRQSRELEQHSERMVHQCVDGLIYNFDPAFADAKNTEYGNILPAMVFHSYPMPEFFVSPPKEQVETPERRLAFIGTLAPSSLPHDYWGDVQLLPLFRRLMESGFAVDVFTLPYQQAGEAGFADYHYLEKSYAEFRLHTGLPPDSLCEKLVNYDFGIMFYDFEGVRVLSSHLSGIMPSKFYTFLESCLPVIVSEELAYVAGEVRKYGLGIVVTQEEVHKPELLLERIDRTDREALRKNILAYREEQSMNAHISRMLAFYEKLRLREVNTLDAMNTVRERVTAAVEAGTPLVLVPYLPDPSMAQFLERMGIAEPGITNIQCCFDNMKQYHHLKLFEKFPVFPRVKDNIKKLPAETIFIIIPCFGYPNLVASLKNDFCIPEERLIYIPWKE